MALALRKIEALASNFPTQYNRIAWSQNGVPRSFALHLKNAHGEIPFPRRGFPEWVLGMITSLPRPPPVIVSGFDPIAP